MVVRGGVGILGWLQGEAHPRQHQGGVTGPWGSAPDTQGSGEWDSSSPLSAFGHQQEWLRTRKL